MIKYETKINNANIFIIWTTIRIIKGIRIVVLLCIGISWCCQSWNAVVVVRSEITKRDKIRCFSHVCAGWLIGVDYVV